MEEVPRHESAFFAHADWRVSLAERREKMKETTKLGTKICPACQREYPEQDNYCGVDGSALEQGQVTGALPPVSTSQDAESGDSITPR